MTNSLQYLCLGGDIVYLLQCGLSEVAVDRRRVAAFLVAVFSQMCDVQWPVVQ